MCCGLIISRAAIAQKEVAAFTGEDLISLLQRMHANIEANDKLAQQYACDDLVKESYFNKKSKKLRDHSEKVETLFVGVLPYHHIVEENGKPLNAQKLVSEQKHQDALSDLGRGFDFSFDLRESDPRSSFYSALPICCLVTLFDNRVLRHEQINGRDNLVVESVPKANPDAVTPVERTALDWKETTWIDVDDQMPTRYEVELLPDRSYMLKGTAERREFLRMEGTSDSKGRTTGTVWLWNYSEGHTSLKGSRGLLFITFEDTSYNFKKFEMDMRLLPDSVQDVPHNGASQKP
jgi:hypothetical protein